MRSLTISLAIASLTAVASAASPVGKWTGKVSLTLPPLPANMPAGQKATQQKMIAQIKAYKILLTVKADKTYSVKITGFPGSPPDDAGKWSQSGSSVTMKSTKKNGQTQTFKLSADGKTMSLNAPNGQGGIVFKRS